MTRGMPRRIFGILLTVACLAGLSAARAQDTRPTVLLLDGLFIYVHQTYVGVSALAPRLEEMGYRAVVDTHLMARTSTEEPALIIGHSMGGTSALKHAAQMVAAGKPAPVILTIDAAFGSPPCPVARCTNYFSPGFPKLEGAENVDAWQAGAFMVNHAMLATNETVQRLVLQKAAALLAERQAAEAARRTAELALGFTPPTSAPVPMPRPR